MPVFNLPVYLLPGQVCACRHRKSDYAIEALAVRGGHVLQHLLICTVVGFAYKTIVLCKRLSARFALGKVTAIITNSWKTSTIFMVALHHC
ncbi:hypothetical protein GDO86_007531 [Hymenochirus boettgeri]|uniref:Uncharacterized protein n=1 Tax=Hymenochirus boettgeri TaxID=247094 RepID=A0A8T2J1B4_9PIPI|nr:hypothetical protein GDO86_007531 [Hymenochirus boettgeri]